ncbi:acyltransferase family protein [Arthrobacter sp. KK5.5]|uniref:acyltransferase family protein n=1 Tax=Arthrobacter sp. KK5.5 TaxID=3373084 RepID=UPI003EE53F04
MSVVVPGPSQTTVRHGEPKAGFRSDIQGLRAVAVGVVLLYHAGFPLVPGGYVGVDVFFVISGFLITGILLKEVDETNRISLAGFYARRARRILPAALLVLTVVGALSFFLLPRIRWETIGLEIVGSAFNVVNWIFADAAADYLRAGVAASPVQHFWSLSVEEQFYVVWPLLLVGAAYAARPRSKRHAGRRKTEPVGSRFRVFVVTAVVVISVPSLAYSIHLTATDPGPAYFVTTTRVYEFGVGAIVAVFAPQLAGIGRRFALILGWGGLAGILVSALLFTSGIPFPGYAALLPTVGGAAVIIAGLAGRDRSGAGRVLSLKPMTWLGGISYSLYLWHWPLIVIAAHVLGGRYVAVSLLVVAFSLVPAYLSHKYVEQPIMRWRYVEPNTVALQMGLLGMLTTSLAVVLVLVATPAPAVVGPVGGASKPTDETGGLARFEVFGAEALALDRAAGSVRNAQGAFKPNAESAADDNPAVYGDGCHLAKPETKATACIYGHRSAEYTVAVVGDSHAAHWVPGLTRLANEEGFRLVSHTKSGCPLSNESILDPKSGGADRACSEWGKDVIRELSEEKPDLVLVSSFDYRVAPDHRLSDGLAGAWAKLQDAGLKVAVLMDTPSPGIDIPECVSVNADSLERCAVDRVEALANGGRSAQEQALQASNGISVIDVTKAICPEARCSPVIGGVLVYRDTDHLTATYSETLAPALREALAKVDGFDPPK